jgi:target of rapamycin complex subunit LST8
MSAVVLATAGYDHKIRFWEASREKCTKILRYPDSQVNALAITNDKQYIAAVGHQHAKIFEVHRGEGNPVRSYDAHSGNVTAVGFQSDSKWMYTSSEDKCIRIWDLRAPRCQRQYECPAGVNSVALSPTQVHSQCSSFVFSKCIYTNSLQHKLRGDLLLLLSESLSIFA